MAKRNDRPPLMVRVWAELGSGRITEAYIKDADKKNQLFTDGYIDEGSKHITINPVHPTVDTIIHEILHRLHPTWKESYVCRTTTYLRRRMSDEETQAFYQEYQKRKRRRRRPLDVTEA
jgi:hypothetical protein